MERNKKIIDEVNKTISLLDSIENIEANPFLYTRIKSKLKSEVGNRKAKPFEIVLKILSPVIIILLLLVNIYSAISFLKDVEVTEKARQKYINYLVSEYSLNQTNDYLTSVDIQE